MPLLAMGVFFAAYKVLYELAKTDGKPLTQDHEAPKCCSMICTKCAVNLKGCANLECCSEGLPRCSGLCTQCSARCDSCSGFWLPLSLRCNGLWLQLTTCLMNRLNGLSKCLQVCLSPFEKIPGCQGIATVPKLVLGGLKRGMLGWLTQSTNLPLMRFVAQLITFVSPGISSCALSVHRISILAMICFVLTSLV